MGISKLQVERGSVQVLDPKGLETESEENQIIFQISNYDSKKIPG